MCTSPGSTFIFMDEYSNMKNVTLKSVNISGSTLLEYQCGPNGWHVRIDDVNLYDSETLVKVGASLGNGILLTSNIIVHVDAQFSKGFSVINSTSNLLYVFFTNLVWNPSTLGISNFMEMFNIQSLSNSNPNVFVFLSGIYLINLENLSTGVAISVEGLSELGLTTASIAGFSTGLLCPNNLA